MAKVRKGHRGVKKPLTRKDIRKEKKLKKKENKRLYFSGKSNGKRKMVKAMTSEKSEAKTLTATLPVCEGDDESISSNFSDHMDDVENCVQMRKKKKSQFCERPDAMESYRKDIQEHRDLIAEYSKQRLKQLTLDNEEESRAISKLEKKLKLNKGKNKKRLINKMFDDGLDYALDLCMSDDEEKSKHLLEEKCKARFDHDNSSSEEESSFKREPKTDTTKCGHNYDDMNDDNEESLSAESCEEDNEDLSNEASPGEPVDEYREDIYGRQIDRHGDVIREHKSLTDTFTPVTQESKYVPPHARNQIEMNADRNASTLETRLQRNCKGLLNRLSEANLHKICSSMEELYMQNSRYHMNNTLTALIEEALIGTTMTNERLVQEHIVLLAYLHAHIGSEIGAHFLQHFIEQLDKFINDLSTSAVDKRLNNLISVLSYMYMFKLYEHQLLFEIIDRLADNLCEKCIECLLVIFQTVGFKLRKDDPLAFKQMITRVQKKAAEMPSQIAMDARIKFMIDILNAVKNNNMNKLPQYDPALGENLRKRLKIMLRQNKYVTTLNITMKDLLRADQIGKWWIVGSAWSGNVNDIGATTRTSDMMENSTTGCQRFSDKILALAKKQKMNTDERRNIFCIIMSAEDYVDAFEKILHLALKDQRSIAYVIIHCCLNEIHFNPYYAHLALKFCLYNRKFQLAFQFAIWDRLKEIHALSKQQIKNIAKFLLYLIVNNGILLSVLKTVNFLHLNKSSFLLMREVICGLLLNDDENIVNKSFESIAKNPNLCQFKNSIRLFMKHFLMQNGGHNLKLSHEQLDLLKHRVDIAERCLIFVDL